MITLIRKFKLLVLKTKWELALWKFADQQIMELIENPEELMKKFIPYLSELVHTSNNTND